MLIQPSKYYIKSMCQSITISNIDLDRIGSAFNKYASARASRLVLVVRTSHQVVGHRSGSKVMNNKKAVSFFLLSPSLPVFYRPCRVPPFFFARCLHSHLRPVNTMFQKN